MKGKTLANSRINAPKFRPINRGKSSSDDTVSGHVFLLLPVNTYVSITLASHRQRGSDVNAINNNKNIAKLSSNTPLSEALIHTFDTFYIALYSKFT